MGQNDFNNPKGFSHAHNIMKYNHSVIRTSSRRTLLGLSHNGIILIDRVRSSSQHHHEFC